MNIDLFIEFIKWFENKTHHSFIQRDISIGYDRILSTQKCIKCNYEFGLDLSNTVNYSHDFTFNYNNLYCRFFINDDYGSFRYITNYSCEDLIIKNIIE